MNSPLHTLHALLSKNLKLIAALFVVMAVAGLLVVHLYGKDRLGEFLFSLSRDVLTAMLYAGTAGLFYELAVRRELAVIAGQAIHEHGEDASRLVGDAARDIKVGMAQQLAECKTLSGKLFASMSVALGDPEIAWAIQHGQRIEIVGYTSATTQEAFLTEPTLSLLRGKEVTLLVRAPEAPVPFLGFQPDKDLAEDWYQTARQQGVRDRVEHYWRLRLRDTGATLSVRYYEAPPFAAGFVVDRTVGVLELFRPEWKSWKGGQVIDYAARPKGVFMAMRISSHTPYENQLLELFRSWLDVTIKHLSNDRTDASGGPEGA